MHIKEYAIKFLSPNHPAPSSILIVEGWLSHKWLEQAALEFMRGAYTLIITSGPKRSWFPTDEHGNTGSFASYAKHYLIQKGIDASKIAAVPAPPVQRHRTYFSANSVAAWVEKNHPYEPAVTVLTWSIHGRKTWVLFRRAFKGKKVGIISLSGSAPASFSVKAIVKCFLGWLYALLWRL